MNLPDTMTLAAELGLGWRVVSRTEVSGPGTTIRITDPEGALTVTHTVGRGAIAWTADLANAPLHIVLAVAEASARDHQFEMDRAARGSVSARAARHTR